METKEELYEKLIEKGVRSMADIELLKVILQNGTRGKSIDKLADDTLRIIDRYAVPEPEQLLRYVPELGSQKALMISASLEIGRRRNVRKKKKIITPEDVYNEVRHYADRQQEHLIILSLNGAHEILRTEVVTVGLLDMTIVHPREVFSTPLKERASAIIMVHNHPSGIHEEASKEDIAITARIRQAGQLLGIKLLDHVIISENGYMSFSQKGML